MITSHPGWRPLRPQSGHLPSGGGNGGLVSYYSHAGQMIAMRNSSGLHWIFGDHLGSSSTVRTAAGTNLRQRYLPFGPVRVAKGGFLSVQLMVAGGVELDDGDLATAPTSRDPGDQYLVALARTARAVLVTGDADLLVLGERLPIVNARTFLEMVDD